MTALADTVPVVAHLCQSPLITLDWSPLIGVREVSAKLVSYVLGRWNLQTGN